MILRNALLAAGFAMLLAPGARAQAPAAEVAVRERVEVTGSHIRRLEGEGALPVQVITGEELARTAVQTVQDVVDRVSAHQSFGGWNESQGIGDSRAGFTAIALRGLGRERTLVLLNGQRVAPYALAGGIGVDLSAIPVSAIERIEVLKDGASAVYGTDAIGGVINFILRRDFKGFELGSQGLWSERGGGGNWRANAAAGYGDLARDGYNVFLLVDHMRQNALRSADRESTRTAYLPWLGLDNTSGNSFPANIQQPGGFSGTRNPTVLSPGGDANSCRLPLSFPTQTFPLRCQFDFAAVIETIPRSDKTTALARYTLALPSGDKAFAELAGYRGLFEGKISPTPVDTGFTNTPMALPPSSPYYPGAFVASLGGDPSRPVNVRYRLFELGPRVDDTRSTLWRFLASLEGVRGEWDYHAGVNYVENRERASFKSGYVSENLFGPLLRSGVVNPFGNNDPATLERMRATQIIGPTSDNRASNLGADVKVSRTLVELAGGPLATALGFEWRREALEQVNAEVLYTGDVIGGNGVEPSLPEVRRRVASLYAELNAPLTSRLEGNLAVRVDHYDDFGVTTNPKVTLRWQAAKDVLLRASWGTGFRAPTLSELFLPAAPGSTFGSDPLRCPVTQSEDDCDIDIRTRSGGNASLRPEKSHQVNVGLVLEATRSVSITLDYYRVEVRNVLDRLTADAALADPARWEATRIVRRAPDPAHPGLPGPIDYVIDDVINFGILKTSGYDLDVKARLPDGAWGRISAGFTGSYVVDYRRGELTSLAPSSVGRRGVELGAISRWRHNANVDWSRGPWAATIAQNFQLGYLEPDLTTCDFGGGNCTSDRRVGSYEIWDANVRYSGIRNATLAFGVRNLFDRAPPVSSQSAVFQVGIDPSYGDPRGRMFFASVRYRFK